MKTKLFTKFVAICYLLSAISEMAFAQGTAFTYQGRLNDGANAATGSYDLQFGLYDAVTAGTQQGSLLTNSAVAVSNGLFTLTLDFGGQFPGANRWLEIGVRTNAGGAFSTLSPRQKITPTPYAITASNLSGILPASQLSGPYSSAVTLSNVGNSFSGSGAGLTGLNAAQLTSGTVPDARLAGNVARTNQVWLLGGNAGTTPGTQFLGTSDNLPLELHVNGRRALRLEPTADIVTRSNLVNVVNGASVNFVASGAYGATIGGGGAGNYDGVGLTNNIAANLSTIGGGGGNTILINSDGSTISGGSRNQILGGDNGVIAGGVDNTIQTNSRRGVISGGQGNAILSNTFAATISGGYFNTVGSNSDYATIPGGTGNTASGVESTAMGRNNTASGFVSTAMGDGTTASGGYSTAMGFGTTASGDWLTAMGLLAQAVHDGSFVWADSQGDFFSSTAINQFSVRANGGVVFVAGSAGVKLGSSGQYFAPGGSENLRILRGVVDSSGNAIHGAGFTAVRTGTGAYTVTFNSAFADFPAVTVSAQSGVARMATTTNVGVSSAQIRTFDGTGAAVDAQFHFIAIGTQ